MYTHTHTLALTVTQLRRSAWVPYLSTADSLQVSALVLYPFGDRLPETGSLLASYILGCHGHGDGPIELRLHTTKGSVLFYSSMSVILLCLTTCLLSMKENRHMRFACHAPCVPACLFCLGRSRLAGTLLRLTLLINPSSNNQRIPSAASFPPLSRVSPPCLPRGTLVPPSSRVTQHHEAASGEVIRGPPNQ